MRILLTNNTLDRPGGSERYIEEVCLHLLKTGHTPIAYSSRLGNVAESLREKGVLVIGDLRQLSVDPDVIHSHHHLDAAYATTYFPFTPCVHFCHGVIPWEENCIPNTTQIARYVAISELTREKLLCSGIPENKISIVPNWVDQRFPFGASERQQKINQAGRTLSIRALIYGNNQHKHEKNIADACRTLEIELNTIGANHGNSTMNPEELGKGYDIAFCYGKAAMEFIWMGADVIASCDKGIGDLITDSNFEFHRNRNFGFSCCLEEKSTNQIMEILRNCLERINRGEPGWISEHNRRSLNSETHLKTISDLLIEAACHSQGRPSNIKAEWFLERSRSNAEHLRFIQQTRMHKLPLLEHELSEAEQRARKAEAKLAMAEAKLEAEKARLESAQMTINNLLSSKKWRYSSLAARAIQELKQRTKWVVRKLLRQASNP